MQDKKQHQIQDKDSERYSRQIILPEIGTIGQKILHQKKVAIIGIGALGTVAIELLARAGVRNLILIDRDIIEESNLQRQILFNQKDIGKHKVKTAQEKLKEINSNINTTIHPIHLNQNNINILKEVDLILDCTDNLQTRFLLNDFSKKNKITWIYAAAIKTSGYVLPIFPSGPCLSCFLKETSLETCDALGVLNTITTSIAALQATLALKILLNKEVESTLYYYNIWNQEFKKIKINKNKKCPACNQNYIYLEQNPEENILKFCSAGKYQILSKNKIDYQKLKENWQKLDLVIDDGISLRFKNIMLFKDGRVLIKAKNESEAQTIYSKYVGN